MRCDDSAALREPPSRTLDRGREAHDADDRRRDDDGRDEPAETRAWPVTPEEHALHGWV